MKAITIKQPFATLIALGYKEYEFRTWKTNYRGEILIHAAKSVDAEAMKRFERYNLTYPTGCIIAKAVLSDCYSVDELFRKKLQKENEYIYHGILRDVQWTGYAFQLKNIKPIEPVYVKGNLSLWEYQPEQVKFCASES